MSEEQFEKQQWIYIGHVMGADDKPAETYLPIVDGKPVPPKDGLLYSVKRGVYHVIGGVYEMECTPDRSKARRGSAKFLRRWSDEEEIVKWKLQSESVDAVVTARRKERDAKKIDLSPLDPLREAYWRAKSYDQQIAMELLVLRYLRQRPSR